MMKNMLWTLAICLAGLFVVVGVSGCKGPEGPTGLPGKDASVGALDGFKEGIKCAECHDAASDTIHYVAAKVVQWEASVHAAGGAFFENAVRNATPLRDTYENKAVERFGQHKMSRHLPVVSHAIHPIRMVIFLCAL
jgi:hypothetical protein